MAKCKRCLNFPNYSVDIKGRVFNRDGDQIYQESHRKGYLRVKLWRDYKKWNVKVHRLVLEAFRGPCPEEHESRHLDGDNTNNRLSNLVWGFRATN